MFPVYACVSSRRLETCAKFKSPSMLFQEGIVEVSLAILD